MLIREGVNSLKPITTEAVRVNTRISKQANEWLDSRSSDSGIPKSTLILLAIENYIREQEAFTHMGTLNDLLHKVEGLEKAVQRNVQE